MNASKSRMPASSFRRIFMLSALFLLAVLSVLALFIWLGVHTGIQNYNQQLFAHLEQSALEIARNPDSEQSLNFSHSSAFFVFRADKSLLFSNRGQGKTISAQDMHPVYIDGRIVAYWYSPVTELEDDRFASLLVAGFQNGIVAGLLVTILLALLAAWLLGRLIGGPIALLSRDLHELAGGSVLEERNFWLSDMSYISSRIAQLSTTLSGYEDYRRRWMQDMAHDARTPLSALRAQLEGMRDGVLQADNAHLQASLTQIGQLEQLVFSMEELYRVETLHSLSPTACNAADLQNLFASVLSQIATESRPALEWKVPPAIEDSPWPLVRVDRVLFERVARNLLANAAQHGEPARPLRLSLEVRPEDGMLRLTACNPAGSGAQPDTSRVFERFYRADSARSEKGNTGLGLSIVQEIVRRHGGTVHAELRDGYFCVHIDLPLAKDSAGNGAENAHKSAGTGAANAHKKEQR